MTELDATLLIYRRIDVRWDSNVVPVTADNEGFTPPSGRPWIRITVRDLPSSTSTPGREGARRFHRRGLLIAQVFGLADVGARPALELAHQFRQLFEGESLPSLAMDEAIHFNASSLRRIGVDGPWYQVNVDAPFYYFEIK